MAQVIRFIPLVMGIVAALVGLGAVFFPEKSSAGFGVKVLAENSVYVRTTGIRDVFIGLIFLYLFQSGDTQGLCLASLATALVSFADFFITLKFGNSKAWAVHLAATVFLIGYAVCLHGQ